MLEVETALRQRFTVYPIIFCTAKLSLTFKRLKFLLHICTFNVVRCETICLGNSIFSGRQIKMLRTPARCSYRFVNKQIFSYNDKR